MTDSVSQRVPKFGDMHNFKQRLYYPTVLSTVFGSISGFIYNYYAKKPIALGGVWKLPAGIILGYLIGDRLDKYLFERKKLNYLIMLDYIQKHPQEFPELERKRLRDVLADWNPVRGN